VNHSNLPAKLSTRNASSPTRNKADLHLHTTYSDGLMTPEETVEIVAQHTSLKIIAITDHDTAGGALIAQEYALRHHFDLEVVIGQEVSTADGDVLALFIHSSLPVFDSAAEAIEAIHRQGGLAVAAHPFALGWEMTCVQRAILHLPFDAVEVRHGCPVTVAGNWYTQYLNRRGQRLPELGSSDSHVPYTAGEAFTWFPGASADDLRRAIVTKQVQPGGSLWTPRNILRVMRVIAERGWPKYLRDAELIQAEG
jgi:predicted metal-dependent phosphoesterase TrpH